MTYRKALTPRAPPIPTEHEEQVFLFKWALTQRVTHPELRWLFAIPNQGGKGKAAMVHSAQLKREGLQPGYPDVGLDVARGPFHGIRVELKRRRNGRFSEEQAKWRDWLLSQGYAHHLAFGWNAAADALLAYLALPHEANTTP